MAYATPLFADMQTMGVNVSGVYTPSTATSTAFDPAYPGPYQQLGTYIQGNQGTELIFVQVATSCSPGNIGVISTTGSWLFTPLTTSLAATSFGSQLGVVLVTGTTGQQCWAITGGATPALGVNTAAATTAGVPLYTTATAGVVCSTGTAATNYPIYGITLVNNASSTNSTTAANITSIELGLIFATTTTPPYSAF